MGGIDASQGIRFGASADVLNAAFAGGGLAIGKTALAIDDLKAGRLVCLFNSAVPEDNGLLRCLSRSLIGSIKDKNFQGLDVPRIRGELNAHQPLGRSPGSSFGLRIQSAIGPIIITTAI